MVKSYTMRENNKMTYKNYVTQNISKIRLKTMSSDNMTSFLLVWPKAGETRYSNSIAH